MPEGPSGACCTALMRLLYEKGGFYLRPERSICKFAAPQHIAKQHVAKKRRQASGGGSLRLPSFASVIKNSLNVQAKKENKVNPVLEEILSCTSTSVCRRRSRRRSPRTSQCQAACQETLGRRFLFVPVGLLRRLLTDFCGVCPAFMLPPFLLRAETGTA